MHNHICGLSGTGIVIFVYYNLRKILKQVLSYYLKVTLTWAASKPFVKM